MEWDRLGGVRQRPNILTAWEIFANALVGYAVATTMYGITVLQTYIYFRRYSNDRLTLKLYVAVLWMLDTLTTLLMSHALYTLFVLNLRNLENNLQLPWCISQLENGITDVITAMVQIYFAQRLWEVSQGNKILSGVIVVLALLSLGLGIEGTIKVFEDHDLVSVSFRRALVLGGAVQGVAVLCDILITGGLCYYFSTSRTGRGSTNKLLDKLMAYAIERGALTATVQTMYLITSVALPDRFFYVPFAMIVAKMYVNTLLASLNVRGTIDYGTTWPELGNRSSLRFGGRSFNRTGSLTASATQAASNSADKSEPSGHGGSTTHVALETFSNHTHVADVSLSNVIYPVPR
ncbi:hypothetical protein C8Q76DRAFT_318154 [Earliella scabrosa]|nr:hypothetical protein C8Q76DRAFT_318154 [Earliella scabrosa]